MSHKGYVWLGETPFSLSQSPRKFDDPTQLLQSMITNDPEEEHWHGPPPLYGPMEMCCLGRHVATTLESCWLSFQAKLLSSAIRCRVQEKS